MYRMTVDAVVVQSVLAIGEKVQIDDLATMAFGSSSSVALSRTSRAVSVLASWQFVEQHPPTGRVQAAASREDTCEGMNPRSLQLWACIARMIWQRYEVEQQ